MARNLQVDISGNPSDFDRAMDEAARAARKFDRELEGVERAQKAQERQALASAAAVKAFGNSANDAGLKAYKANKLAEQAAQGAEKAQLRAAAAAKTQEKGLITEARAAELAARADQAVERAALKAAEAHRLAARAADEQADQERQLARDAALAAAAQRLAALRAAGAVKQHNALLHSLRATFGDVEQLGEEIGRKTTRSIGSSLGSGLAGSFREVGARGMAALGVAMLAASPGIGALAASALVLAFGGGLAGLGLVAATQFKGVKKEFSGFAKFAKGWTRDIGSPFQAVWTEILSVAKRVMEFFRGPLKAAMGKFIAPAVMRFVDQLGEAFMRLEPSLPALSKAFADLLDAIGPSLPGIFESISDALIDIAGTISANPDLFASLVTGLIQLVPLALKLVGALAKLFSWLSDHKDDIDSAARAFGMLVTPLGAVAGALDDVKDAASKVRDILGRLGGKGSRIVLSAVDKVSGPAKSAVKSATGFAKGVYRAGLTAVSKVRGAVGSAVSACSDFARRVYRANLTAINRVKGAVSAATGACAAFARRTFRATLGAVNNVGHVLQQALSMGRSWAGRVFNATFGAIKKIFNTGGYVSAYADGGPVNRYPTGGPVYGQGTGTSDSIPAMLSNGEYVINAAATRRFKPLLDVINYGARVPVSALAGVPSTGHASGNQITQNNYFQAKHEGVVARESARELAWILKG